jgi:ankyrin repeat protein
MLSRDDILWNAVEMSDYLGVESILQEGADINMVNEKGENLLCEAIDGQDFDMIELLIEKGLNVNRLCDDKWCTPLSLAASMSNVHIAKILLKHGANPNRVHGLASPLEMAIKYACKYNMDMVKLLIRCGANVFDCDPKGKTLLMFAAEQMNVEVLHLLIANGLDPEARDTKGHTAIYYARNGKFDDNVAILSDEIKRIIHRRKSSEAFALGNLSRTGESSLVDLLDPDLVALILQMHQDA